MGVHSFSLSAFANPIINPIEGAHKLAKIELPSSSCRHQKIGAAFPKLRTSISYSASRSDGGGEEQNSVQELRIPSHWLEPSKALERDRLSTPLLGGGSVQEKNQDIPSMGSTPQLRKESEECSLILCVSWFISYTLLFRATGDLITSRRWRNLEESEWLRVTLHKWLDDEYCPEATNIEISRIAANSFYKSLEEKRVDLGEILLKMASELQSISYQESFHGAFSSANAAVSLIVQRMVEE